MADRPVFFPAPDAPGLVREKSFTIDWAGGFAAVQKKKNIAALHKAAEACGCGPILEASTKSDEKLGQRLSAFNLKVQTDDGEFPLECAYQGSKVFERGGPYTDLFFAEPKVAKRDPRLQSSGRLIAFAFAGHKFPLEPKTVFYDWLYIKTIFPYRDFLFQDERLPRYAGFTDIEFNPSKSINCQARSCALFVSLREKSLLEEAVSSPDTFIAMISKFQRVQPKGATAHVEPKTAREQETTVPLHAEMPTELPAPMAQLARQASMSAANVSGQAAQSQKVASEYVNKPIREEQLAELAIPLAQEAQDAAAATAAGEIVPPAQEPKASEFDAFLREQELRDPKRAQRSTTRRRGKKVSKKGLGSPMLGLPPQRPR